MGERSKDALKVTFDKQLKLEFHGTKVTPDATFKANNLNFGRILAKRFIKKTSTACNSRGDFDIIMESKCLVV
jgi:hypothetical protein